jgi:hypothetical protein
VPHGDGELGPPKRHDEHDEGAVAWSYESRNAAGEEPEEWDEM